MRTARARAPRRALAGIALALVALAAAPNAASADGGPTKKTSSEEEWIDLEPFSIGFRFRPLFWYSFGQMTQHDEQNNYSSQGVRASTASFDTHYIHAHNPVVGGEVEVFFMRRIGIGAEGGLSVANSLSDLTLKTSQDFPIRQRVSNFQLDSRGRYYFTQESLYLRVVPPEKTGDPGWYADVWAGYGYFEDDWKDREAEGRLTSTTVIPGAVRETHWRWHVLRLGVRIAYDAKYVGFEARGGLYPWGDFQSRERYFQSGTSFGLAGGSNGRDDSGFAGGEFHGIFVVRPIEMLRLELGYRVVYLHADRRSFEAESIRHGPQLSVAVAF